MQRTILGAHVESWIELFVPHLVPSRLVSLLAKCCYVDIHVIHGTGDMGYEDLRPA
jgi:hypothetical protein